MSELIDNYLKSTDKAELEELRSMVVNMIGPVQGTAAAAETLDEDGNVLEPAQEAKGDPNYWYACVRSIFSVPAFGTVVQCDEGEGIAVLGEWLG